MFQTFKRFFEVIKLSGTSSAIGLKGNLTEYLSLVNDEFSKYCYILSSLLLTPTDSISKIVDSLYDQFDFQKHYIYNY